MGDIHKEGDYGYLWGGKQYNVSTTLIDRASLFTNQRKLNVHFARKSYEDTRRKKMPMHSNITLCPMSFKRLPKDEETLASVSFQKHADFLDAFDNFRHIDIICHANVYQQ